MTEDPNALNASTLYSYDGLDNLTAVNQSGKLRSFFYNGLGRLTRATNPETGSVNYSYDPVGNLVSKTDARGVITCYGILSGSQCQSSYDPLNRAPRKSYSDGTPAVTYAYGSGRDLSTGKLLSASNANSTTSYTNFNALGQPQASSQMTSGQTYGFAYTYNAAGDMTAMTYPSGRTVKTGYDGANRPAWLSGTRLGLSTNYIGNPNDTNNTIHY